MFTGNDGYNTLTTWFIIVFIIFAGMTYAGYRSYDVYNAETAPKVEFRHEYIVICRVDDTTVEIKNRRTGTIIHMSVENAYSQAYEPGLVIIFSRRLR